MGQTVLMSRTRFILILVGAAVLCIIIGISCFYGGKAQGEDSETDVKDTGSSGQVETSTAKPLTPTDEDDFLPGTAPWLNLHLPSYTVPKHYDLTLYPNFYEENDVFTGNVTIEIDIKQATRYLLVHIKKLDVEVTSVKDKETNTEYGVDKEWGYEPNQFWIAKTSKLINESSTVLLSIRFNGSLSEGIVGFYKAFYANNTKAMATSKFEPVDARKAFPCFDEPNLKATYTTTLIHKQGFTPLSNMPVEKNTTRPDGLIETQFQKSVAMSTYLACFIVCECTYDEIILESGKPFRVYAVEGSEDQIDYALKFGANVTNFFVKYFGLDYPLPKMDMIAIPDFVSGAMEHWGLITYRETNLLYKEGVSSPSNKQRIAEVVAHELAHQWFGNIVTMDWWDDLWLNEGFATFMSYVGTEPFEPTMEVTSQFAALEIFTVMPEDSVASSHPIIVPVNRPEDITAVFDAISYNKGASVIRMLEAFVGKATFQTGLQDYLKRYRFDNAKTYQLWESIGENVKDFNVEHIMDTWTKQSGFPLVTIEYDEVNNKITARQERFKYTNDDGANWPDSKFQYKWDVPLHYIYSDGVKDAGFPWISSNSSSSTFDSPIDLNNSTQWIKFNKDATGYYKVNYPNGTWYQFADLLKANAQVMPVGDRSGLVYDAITLPSYGHLAYSTALNLISYLSSEDHYVVWISVSSELFQLRDWLDDQQWNDFVVDLVSPSYARLGWNEGGSHLDQLLRGSVIRLACGHEYSECLKTAKDKFTQWLDDPLANQVPAAIRRDMFTYGMVNVTSDEWDQVWDRYNLEPVASAKVDMRRGLARTQNETLINRYLSYANDKDKVADQDFFSVISYLSGNKKALPIVWDWTTTNYEKLETRFGLDNRYFGRMIPGIASYFTTQQRKSEVEAFYSQYPEAGAGKRAREQSLETIQNAISWKQNYGAEIQQWLQDF